MAQPFDKLEDIKIDLFNLLKEPTVETLTYFKSRHEGKIFSAAELVHLAIFVYTKAISDFEKKIKRTFIHAVPDTDAK